MPVRGAALVPDPVRYVRREQAPLIPAPVFIRHSHEPLDLILGPVPVPRVFPRRVVPVKVAVWIFTNHLPREFLRVLALASLASLGERPTAVRLPRLTGARRQTQGLDEVWFDPPAEVSVHLGPRGFFESLFAPFLAREVRWGADAFVVEREEVAGVLRGLELGGERGVGVVKDGEAAGFGAGRRRRRLVGGTGTLGFSSLDDVGV